MRAELISITKPIAEKVKDMTPEEFLAYQARVSNPSNQLNNETAEGLLRYCLIRQHWSVFEMVDVTFEIETSRAIMAQILRHWSFRFQEFSQRYAAASGFESVEIRKKHKDGNRQGSSDAITPLSTYANGICEKSLAEYESMITHLNVAPETARMILPLSTTTIAYMKGNIRSWITYFYQRLDAHAQKEHRLLAQLMFNQFQIHFPLIASIIKHGRFKYEKEEWMP